MYVGKPLDSFKTLHEKRLYRKLMQILRDPTHPMRQYFESRQEWKIFTSENKYKPLLSLVFTLGSVSF